jgi:hypothetical protein
MSHSSGRRAPTRDPLTYATVSEWWADWWGFAPVQMAHHLSKLEQAGIPFPEAWRIGLASGAIILIDRDGEQPSG